MARSRGALAPAVMLWMHRPETRAHAGGRTTRDVQPKRCSRGAGELLRTSWAMGTRSAMDWSGWSKHAEYDAAAVAAGSTRRQAVEELRHARTVNMSTLAATDMKLLT